MRIKGRLEVSEGYGHSEEIDVGESIAFCPDLHFK